MKLRSRDFSNAKFVPLQILCGDNGRGDHGHYPSNRQLAVPPNAVVAQSGSYSRFELPDEGWFVEEVPRRLNPSHIDKGRRNPSHIDKYYYEEGSGKKFKSLKEVERYIKSGEYPSRSRVKVSCSYFKHPRYSERCPRYSKRYIMRGGKMIRLDKEAYHKKQPSIVKSIANARLSFTELPDGWVIEEVPRRLGGSDKYYYEPGTRLGFRSLVAVFRHLEEEIPLSVYIEEIKENVPLSKAFKLHHKGKNVSRKRNLTTSSNGDGHTSSFVSPPKKIEWILGNTEGVVWYPLIFDTPVPDSVKQQWYERFMEVMKDDDNQHLSIKIL